MFPLQLPQGQKSGDGQHILRPSSFQRRQRQAVHSSRITEIAGVFSHLPSEWCLQSSQFPATALFLALLTVSLPPFSKSFGTN